jgi:hypothetical protein
MTALIALFGTALGVPALMTWRQASFAVNPALFVLRLLIAVLLPLVGYLVFLRIGYTTFSWAPFSDGSLLPIVIAALGSAVALLLLLRTQHFRRATTLVFFAGCALIWFALLVSTALYIACSAGDCL